MITVAASQDSMTIDSTIEVHVNASPAATFAALLEELGPHNLGRNDAPMPMVLEPWPGGRWYRDLGNEDGHCWGHVQAIRRPGLLEICGPLMMSFAVSSNVQYRVKEADGGAHITMHHTAFGMFPDGFREELTAGFSAMVMRVRERFPTS